MTKQQLTAIGIPLDTWTNLNSFVNLQFSNDAHLYPSETSKYFFESDSDLVFVRFYLTDNIILPGGIKDTENSDVGIYHNVYRISEITSIQ